MPQTQFHAQAGRLLEPVAERPGAVEWRVRLADGSEALAFACSAFNGNLSTGQEVWLNTTAVELGLGTGGAHFVLSPVGKSNTPGEACIGARPERSAGHLMKLRYTPLQHAVRPIEERLGGDGAQNAASIDLARLPVVAAELHSTAMAAAVAAKACGARRVVYVMTDGAALPLPVSRLVARLRADGTLARTITTGQAFGGDEEAVTVASALVAARVVLEADLAIVAQGPGNAGTGTALGFSGLAQAEHLNIASALNGRPIAALRVSFAEPRPRHRSLSDHTVMALGRMTLARVGVAVPDLLPELSAVLRQALAEAGFPERHDLRQVAADDLLEALTPYHDQLMTMGRTIEEDRAFFLAACAAARLAVDPGSGRPWSHAVEPVGW